MFSDFRFALRSLRRNPSFAAVAALSIALGIGANTAMFSMADAILLRPVPVPHPSRVLNLRSQLRGRRAGFHVLPGLCGLPRQNARLFRADGLPAEHIRICGRPAGAAGVYSGIAENNALHKIHVVTMNTGIELKAGKFLDYHMRKIDGKMNLKIKK